MKLPLKSLRECKGITQAELGQMLGVTSSAIAMYETGQRTPDGEKIVRLAKIFNVSTDYLLGNERNPQYIFSNEESQLVNGYRALNEVGKRTILSLIGQLTGGLTAENNVVKNNRVGGDVNGNAYVAFGGEVHVTGAAM